jgi:hypothetical protein
MVFLEMRMMKRAMEEEKLLYVTIPAQVLLVVIRI